MVKELIAVIDREELFAIEYLANEYTEHTRYVTERLVRTETAHFLSEGQKEAYRVAGIGKYRYLAALSERTCEKCASLDNKVFDLDEATEGVNYPVMHPNCRCVTITADAELKTRLAKDPETCYNHKVDGHMNFAQWKESLTDEQKQAFDLHVRQNKNKSSDKKQYKRYIQRLGTENMPKTFEMFQALKYKEVDKWVFMKLDYRRQNDLYKNPELALPNAINVTADDRKFTGYLFNPSNLDGYAKGKNFTKKLGYDINNFRELKSEIMSRATRYPALYKDTDEHGARYEQKIVLYGKNGSPANVVVGWKVKHDKTWMTSAYIKEVK